MFLRKTQRKKDGKTHDYWSVVEKQARGRRGCRTAPRSRTWARSTPSQAAGWRKAIEVLDDDAGHPRTLALFPDVRCAAVASDSSIFLLRLSDMRLCRPRHWGAGWLAGQLWRDMRLEQFWGRSACRRTARGYALGSGLHVLVSVSIDRARQRMEAAPRLVRQERHGRPVGGRLRSGGVAQAYARHDFATTIERSQPTGASLPRPHVRRVDRSASLVGHAAVSAAAMGRLLAGRAVVAGSAVGAVLAERLPPNRKEYLLGSGLCMCWSRID